MAFDNLTITVLEPSSETERVLKLAGPLTLTTMFDFRDRLRSETARTVILDLTGVPYVDSAGIGAIVNGHVSCANSGRRLALVGVADRARTVMKVSRVDTFLSIYPTLQDARQALAGA